MVTTYVTYVGVLSQQCFSILIAHAVDRRYESTIEWYVYFLSLILNTFHCFSASKVYSSMSGAYGDLLCWDVALTTWIVFDMLRDQLHMVIWYVTNSIQGEGRESS